MLLALVALGAIGSLAVAAALGMKASELTRLAVLLGPATIVTVAAATLASWLLRRTSLRQRYLAIAAVGTFVAIGNLLALAQAMVVSARAATMISVVLVYAGAAGLAAAFVSARSLSPPSIRSRERPRPSVAATSPLAWVPSMPAPSSTDSRPPSTRRRNGCKAFGTGADRSSPAPPDHGGVTRPQDATLEPACDG